MTENEIQQISNLIRNLEEKKNYIPYLSELEHHEVYGQFFKWLPIDQKTEIKEIINNYVKEKVAWLTKTKWGQLFKRFCDNQDDLFWTFRNLNEFGIHASADIFQKTWKQVEQEMFKLEWILTERMLDQEKWLDKVIWSFYNIVYSFFPKYNEIE